MKEFNLEEVENSKGVSVVKVFADWCGPCKLYNIDFEEVEGKMSDVCDFYEMNAEKYQDEMVKFFIRSIPTTLFFKNGELVESKVGRLNAITLESTIKNVMEGE